MDSVTAEVQLPRSRKLTTVDHVSLRFAKGTSTAIVGRSGSGKTSLVSIIGMLNADYRGSYLYEGADIRALSDAERSRFRNRHIGFVFQNYSLIPHLNVWENVALPLRYRRHMSETVIKKRALFQLEAMGLLQRASDRPAQLSGGEQQRVAIARALVAQPDLLICDEPTGALDTETGDMVQKMLFDRVQQSRITLLLVTHDQRLASYCEYQFLMEKGSCHASYDHR
nr:ABC transporter ATP-binding protein [Bifidobacterium callimiconis]